MCKKVLCLVFVFVLATAVWAQGGGGFTPNYNAIIGNSDAIILCGVTDATIPTLPTTGAGGGLGGLFGGILGGTTYSATIKVKVVKVMLGTVKDESLDLTVPLTISFTPPAAGGGGGYTTVWSPDVSVGKNVVIGLVQGQSGWQVTPTNGGNPGGFGGFGMGGSVYTEADVTAIATAIAAYPLKATLTAPTDPLTIGSKVTFTITVKNTGATTMTLGNVSLTSSQASDKLAFPATFLKVSDDTKDAKGVAKTVAAGAEATITAVFTVVGPPNWQLFDPKVFPMASTVAATVTATSATAAGGGIFGQGNYSAKSGWVDAQLMAPKG